LLPALFGVFPARFGLFTRLLSAFAALPRLLAARRSLAVQPFAILSLRPTATRLLRLPLPRRLRSRNLLRNFRFRGRDDRNRFRLLQWRQA
jgi:hypothetical protein